MSFSSSYGGKKKKKEKKKKKNPGIKNGEVREGAHI